MGIGGQFAGVSRESLLLSNNVLLTIAMSAVLLGTLYPLVLDTLNLGKISVAPPYFDAVFFPLMAPAVFLMAIGPMASWKKAELPDLATRLKWALGVALACAIIVPLAKGKWSSLVALGLFLAFWVILATAVQFGGRLKGAPQATFMGKLRANSASWYGMQVAHVGVAVFIIGVAMVKGFETERDVRMAPGDTVAIAGYEFKFTGTRELPGPNYAVSSKAGYRHCGVVPAAGTTAPATMPAAPASPTIQSAPGTGGSCPFGRLSAFARTTP